MALAFDATRRQGHQGSDLLPSRIDSLADQVDWKTGHSRGEPAAALRHVGRNLCHIGRNLIRARGIAVISPARGIAVDVGQTTIAVIAVSRDIGSIVIIKCSTVGPEPFALISGQRKLN